MKTEIIKASRLTYWYSGSIGKIFEVEDVLDNCDTYRLVGDNNNSIASPSGGIFYKHIDKEDCVEVSDTNIFQVNRVSYLDLLEQIENSYIGKLSDREKNIVNRARDYMTRGMYI